MNNPFKGIRNLISNAEFESAINKLMALSENILDKELKNEIILNCANYKKYHRDNLLNLSNDTSARDKAVLMLLEIVDKLEKKWDIPDDAEPISINIGTLVENGELKKAISEFRKLFHLIDEEKDKLEELQSQYGDLSNVPIDVMPIKKRLTNIVKSLETNIPKFLEIVDLPVITYWVNDQKQIIKIAIDKILGNSYDDISFLSYGHSGWYFRARKITSSEDVIIVVLKVSNLNDLPTKDEIKQIVEFRSNNIIKINDYNFDRLPAYAILEHINGITLDKALNLFGGFPLTNALEIMIELVRALSQIQKTGILHTNIRPSKIFIDHYGSPCISSLDIIKFKRDDLRSLTRYKEECQYLSPEVLEMTINTQNIKAIEKSDQFSLGLLLLEMISGNSLFYAETTFGILEKRRNFFQNPSKHLNIPLQNLQNQKSSKALKNLLKIMLEKEPEKRMANLSDVLNTLRNISNQTLLESPLLSSFHTCYSKNPNLLQVFYDRFFDQIPKDIRYHFTSINHQYMMLRYAIYVVFEIEQKEAFLKKILLSEKHRRYTDVSLFKIFLNTLRDTVRDLLGEEWNEETMQQPWDDKIQKVLRIVDGFFQKTDVSK